MEFHKLTPNLVVRDVDASVAFYRDTLSMDLNLHVPDSAPFIFASVRRGETEIFLNSEQAVAQETPGFCKQAVGWNLTQYIVVTGIDELLQQVQRRGAKIVMPLKKQFYGMREFGIADPDSNILIFAERS